MTGCLLKDMNGNIAIYRAYSVRLIGSMSNGTSAVQCLQNAFKDKSPMVQSAAVVCAIKLIWVYIVFYNYFIESN